MYIRFCAFWDVATVDILVICATKIPLSVDCITEKYCVWVMHATSIIFPWSEKIERNKHLIFSLVFALLTKLPPILSPFLMVAFKEQKTKTIYAKRFIGLEDAQICLTVRWLHTNYLQTIQFNMKQTQMYHKV